MAIQKNRIYTSSSARGFIVIDGMNGAGKSSIINVIKPLLEKSTQREIIFSREPGGTPLGRCVRSLFIDSTERVPISALSEVFLFAADRAQHVSEVIEPALQRGSLVLCDRYYYSSIAFQTYGRGIDHDLVFATNQRAIQGCIPDLVLLLDLPVHEALRRTTKRNAQEDLSDTFEEESSAFHERVRTGFLTLAHELEEPFYIINAGGSQEETYAQITEILRSYIAVLA
jgi:dTMP kinase